MFKLFKNLSKKDLLIVICCVCGVALGVFFDLKLPDYMTNITRLVQTPGSVIGDVLKEGLKMLLCAFGGLSCTVVVGYFASIISATFSYKIRDKIYNKVSSFSLEDMKKFQTSSLITRTTNDVTQMEMVIGFGLSALVRAPIMATLAIIKILNKGVEWSILTACCVLILLIVIGILMSLVLPRFKLVQKLIDRLNGSTRENLSGIRVIRAFNAESFENSRFESVNNDLTNLQIFNQRCFSVLFPTMNLIMHSLVLGIYIIGATLISSATIGSKLTLFSNMVVFSSYGMQVIMSFLMLSVIFMMAPRAQVSANRINEILDQDVKIKSGKFKGDTKEKGTVEFKNVSFKYGDADDYVLEDISFKCNQGDTVAFIGSTGSGKSTLINLIPRFYDVTDGEILVDGVNVKDYKKEALMNKLGYIPQKAVMFTGTVKSNVLFGNSGSKLTEEDAKEAIKLSKAKDFVTKMENGIDAHIARGGTNVSGGQKQRLAIARALAKNAEILIFDDSFSALDYKTDRELRDNLKKLKTTNLIVAQRIGTIMNADMILVLDKGKVVGMGTHKELLKNCDVYKEIALSQLSKEELENA